MQLLICDRCGSEASVRGPDSLDWCNECGIVEGNTHFEDSDAGDES